MDPQDDYPQIDRSGETPEQRRERLMRFMREEVWPITAPNGPRRTRMLREEWVRYLGYGPDDE